MSFSNEKQQKGSLFIHVYEQTKTVCSVFIVIAVIINRLLP